MSEENKDKKPDAKIRIEVDSKGSDRLASIIEQERAEKAKEKDPEEELASAKLKMYEKFNKNPMFLDATSKEQLSAMVENYVNTAIERDKPKPSGNAPLNAQQYGQKSEDLYTRKFSSSEEMVSELRRLSHEGSSQEKEEADRYLNALFRQYALDKRANPTRPEPAKNPNSPESLLELDLVQKNGFLTPRNKEDSEIGQLQKKWREERKRRMEGKPE